MKYQFFHPTTFQYQPVAIQHSGKKKLSLFIQLILFCRHSSDDGIRRSSSEIIGGVVFPSNHNSRRGSGMSNSSASLQLNDMHKIFEQSQNEAEIFV